METCWLKAAVIGCVLASGCGETPSTPANDDPQEVDSAGTGGSGGAVTTSDGGGATGGGSVTTHPAQGCVPLAATDASTDAAFPDDASAIDADVGYLDLDGAVAIDDDDAGTPQETETDAGPMVGQLPRVPNRYGEVIVSELMPDPTLLTDALGEWIELSNTTDANLELEGCTISDDRTDESLIASLIIPAHGYVVLARSDQAAPTVDQVIRGTVLANTTDEVIVTCDGILIDRVAYGPGFPRPVGKSMQLDPAYFDADDNDVAAHWCAATGSPGATNPVCMD